MDVHVNVSIRKGRIDHCTHQDDAVGTDKLRMRVRAPIVGEVVRGQAGTMILCTVGGEVSHAVHVGIVRATGEAQAGMGRKVSTVVRDVATAHRVTHQTTLYLRACADSQR